MKTIPAVLSRALRRRPVVLAASAFALGLLLLLLGGPSAHGDVYGNIGPAPQIPPGGLVGRWPLASFQLDEYFNGISIGWGGVDVSGVVPLIAYSIAQIIWLVTAFLANAVITLFGFAFNLDLVNGNGAPGSGALAPISTAIHNLYANTFGAPWLIAAVALTGCWAMWKALVQRRYTETAGALAVSLLYCVLAVGIVTQPQRTIAPASRLSNEISTAVLSLTSHGALSNEEQAKSQAGDQLFRLLVLDPWTILEFGGIEHCTTTSGGKTRSAAVRPLSADPTRDAQLAAQLESGTEVHAEGKTCINDRNKYAPHFLAYPYQTPGRNSEHEALEHGDSEDLPNSDPAKTNGTYPLGPADEPAAEAMGKSGQYERLLLSIVILAGELGAWCLLGALALGVILAQILLLLMLSFAPVALIVGIFPGRGHAFFRAWVGKLAGYLARKVVYSLILAVILAVCQALAEATSNLGWLMAFTLQAAFLWAVFLQRNKLAGDLLHAAAGGAAGRERMGGLQNLYYASGLAGRAKRRRTPPPPASPPPPPAPAPTSPPVNIAFVLGGTPPQAPTRVPNAYEPPIDGTAELIDDDLGATPSLAEHAPSHDEPPIDGTAELIDDDSDAPPSSTGQASPPDNPPTEEDTR